MSTQNDTPAANACAEGGTIRPQPETEQPDEQLDDITSFMAELDAELRATTPARAKRRSATSFPWNIEPEFEAQWAPHGLAFRTRDQRCVTCGAYFQAIDGLFLCDQHRNGALRYTRVENATVPPSYASYQPEQLSEQELLPCCPFCYGRSHDQ